MVSTVDVDKSTVNILISIGDRSCRQNHFPSSGFKQEGRVLTIRNLIPMNPAPIHGSLTSGKARRVHPLSARLLRLRSTAI
jgi:hypothetical protein